MAKVNLTVFNWDIGENIQAAVVGIFGKRCCIQYSGEYKSLTLGFGEKTLELNIRKRVVPRAEWEIGTYTSAWRIIQNGEILCGSMTPVESNAELEQQVEAVQIGAVISIEMLSKFDIRVTLENAMFIDFMCASVDDDTMFHIFGPNHLYIGYRLTDGWQIGKSNEPML